MTLNEIMDGMQKNDIFDSNKINNQNNTHNFLVDKIVAKNINLDKSINNDNSINILKTNVKLFDNFISESLSKSQNKRHSNIENLNSNFKFISNKKMPGKSLKLNDTEYYKNFFMLTYQAIKLNSENTEIPCTEIRPSIQSILHYIESVDGILRPGVIFADVSNTLSSYGNTCHF